MNKIYNFFFNFFLKLPIKNKDLTRLRIRNFVLKIILEIYSLFFKVDLKTIFQICNSDKYDNYKDLYNVLQSIINKKKIKKVLEIGIGGHDKKFSGGHSLIALSHYFKNSRIYGLDIVDKSFLNNSKIFTIVGDQSNKQFMEQIGIKYGKFDLIIDDGSHFADHQIISFSSLYEHLNDGGIYIIEDLHTSYYEGLNGSPNLLSKKNVITFFGHYIHLPNKKNLLKSYLDQENIKKFADISKVFFFKEAILIQKTLNHSEGISEIDARKTLDEFNKNRKNKKTKAGYLEIVD